MLPLNKWLMYDIYDFPDGVGSKTCLTVPCQVYLLFYSYFNLVRIN